MAQESQQPDLFEWKPEEKKSLWFWKILKSKYFWIVAVLLIASIIVWFNYNSIVESLSSENSKSFFSKYWLIIYGSLALILTFLVIWLIPRWQVKTLDNKKGSEDQSEFDLEKERIKLRDDTRKTMAQIIGGTFFILGLFVTYNTFELNREGQVTERYSKAVELIGNENLSIRLGGLYALERIAKDSPKDHATVMEILAAYIREKSREQKEAYLSIKLNPEEQKFRSRRTPKIVSSDYKPTDLEKKVTDHEKEADKQKPNPDIYTAIEIIKRRNIEQDGKDFIFDLQDANLNSIDLNAAILKNAKLNGAHLEWAKVRNINLSNAKLHHVKLSYTDLIVANLEDAQFDDAELIQVTFPGAIVSRANFNNADLRRAILKYSIGLDCEQISDAIIDESTQLPEHCQSRKAEFVENSKKIIIMRGLPEL